MIARGLAALAVVVAACNPAASGPGSEKPRPEPPSAVAPSVGTPSAGTPSSAGASPAARRLTVIEAAQDVDALSLVRTKRLEAKAEGKRLVVYVGATWCEPCKHFKAEIASGRLDARFDKLTLLAFDVDRDGERLATAGYTYRFVPFVAVPGPDGHPAESQEATGKGSGAWRELLGRLDAWQRVDASP